MSVSLIIRWSDGGSESVPIAGMRTAERLAENARRLGLVLIPMFPSFVPVEPDTLDEFIREVKVFRESVAASEGAHSTTVEMLDRLSQAFERLKATSGWKASIG